MERLGTRAGLQRGHRIPQRGGASRSIRGRGSGQPSAIRPGQVEIWRPALVERGRTRGLNGDPKDPNEKGRTIRFGLFIWLGLYSPLTQGAELRCGVQNGREKDENALNPVNQRSMPLWRRSSLTVSFLRPFRRRALKTLRPSTDDMRLRNPCLLRRLRTEGWKVLLLITSDSTPSKGRAKIVEVILFHNRSWILFLTGFFKAKPGAGGGMDLA